VADAINSPGLFAEASSITLAEPHSDFSAASIPAALEDETAPPPQPVTQRDRIPTIDVVRGVALMGILLMNIASFSGPLEMYTNPLIVGHHRTYNLVAWSIRWVLFEGKMRAAFSMLFGAGVILLTERAERRGSKNIADIFLRRNMWLVLFGVVHFYFIWIGDILYWYGLTALLFLYPCRQVRFRNLLIAGALVLAIGSGSDVYFAIDGIRERNQGQEAQALAKAGKKLTTEQQDAMKKWNETLEKRKKDHDDDLKAMRGSYLDQLKWHAQWGPKIQAYYFYTFGFTDTLGMMLIGMGLYRVGFLTGALSYKLYGWIIAAGFLFSIPINGFEALGLIRDNFQPESGWWVLYQAGRLSGAAAIVALVVVVAKAGLVPWLTRHVAAVGQTALSNYLLTSISCTLLFSRYGFGLYGNLEYYQIYAIVACVWALNLILSPFWLRYYRFGPMEWVWRSLTYWKRQPMKRQLEEAQAMAA
jgi:uncharacterized protein